MSRSVALVVPTIGRPSLSTLLDSVAAAAGPLPDQIVVVDDRRVPGFLPRPPDRLTGRVSVLSTGGGGPAAARNLGWRATAEHVDWVVFVDDDVVVGVDWLAELAADLNQPASVGGVQGAVTVPLPGYRRPTDWERNTQGLETSSWITADMAYRRPVLLEVDGFDERFRRAYREDADLAIRVERAGYRLVRGARRTTHPVRPAERWVSVRMQAGNADDVLMRRLHGPRWRRLADAPPGRRRTHLAVTASGAVAALALASHRPRLAAVGLLGWAAGTARFAWSRIASGPRTADEVVAMLLTSVAIPPAATRHWLHGLWTHRHVPADPGLTRPRAVLFDRDGTLIHDVPYNGDPDRVRPVDGAVDVVRRLRARGVPVGVFTNQSGIGRGRLTAEAVRRVNARVEEIFGAFDVWAVCPHTESDRCRCRKPAPGMVLDAAAHLRLAPEQLVVIGDIGADVDAARAAGARGVLVPTASTRAEEVRDADLVASTLAEAVAVVLGGPR